ncbi:MAG: GTP cyclohydrolase I FolE [Deltaproteobacteria bacterium]|nr:GTP cyclohydrolase I FolE [Deltaproteobacteria bacterium]
MTNDDEHEQPASTHAGIGIDTPGAFDPTAFEAAVQAMLRACGVDEAQLQTGHMRSTAKRVRELWERRLLGGVGQDPAEILGTGFDDPREDLVVLRGIAVHGVCPHHLVPFRGVAHVAYLPGGRLHGFGRIARLVDAIGHRFTYQEWLTRDVAEALVQHGKARGAGVVVECEQLCLLLGEDRRGDERVLTTAWSGVFQQDASLRAEVLRVLELPRGV